MPNQMYQNSIFWIEIEKIKPNPFQPRKEFDEFKLRDLADSIKQYGILQPLVVTRREIEKPEGGLAVEYELIAGERRLRASKIAGLLQVPVLIRIGEEGKEEEDRVKLELAIIENLQREDLNPVDRAKAFQRLADDFGFKHVQIAMKVGKSREYVSNTLRLLALPEEMLTALAERKITEGHTRPLLMLCDRKEEQLTLYKEIIFKKLNVRESERIARRIAVEKVRKISLIDPEVAEFEAELTEVLGTRVQIEKKDVGGKIVIDFFSNDDVRAFMKRLHNEMKGVSVAEAPLGETKAEAEQPAVAGDLAEGGEDVMEKDPDEDLYNVKNFSL
ncbi:MAG: ParB-like protein partition protein [Candidatus Nomurabacteria bacterium GW2011_GWD1_44_10]|nr:MAG: ParB-like protein partition protein [Candidatus Nomurabacteria bacterium GW2011_GWD1_44_10]